MGRGEQAEIDGLLGDQRAQPRGREVDKGGDQTRAEFFLGVDHRQGADQARLERDRDDVAQPLLLAHRGARGNGEPQAGLHHAIERDRTAQFHHHVHLVQRHAG
jgi:hypothetical protein